MICIDTADWVRCRKPAARVTPPESATAMKDRSVVMSRFLTFTILDDWDQKNIRFSK
ncbi:hypothetical protein ACFOHS_13100 [Jhaorihella thermophila]